MRPTCTTKFQMPCRRWYAPDGSGNRSSTAAGETKRTGNPFQTAARCSIAYVQLFNSLHGMSIELTLKKIFLRFDTFRLIQFNEEDT